MGAVKQAMLEELWKEPEEREWTETREALEEAREEDREEDRLIEESIQDQLESQKPISGGF
jgi:hypothetical protein